MTISLKIFDSPFKNFGIVLQAPYTMITTTAQKPPDFTCRMIMIHRYGLFLTAFR